MTIRKTSRKPIIGPAFDADRMNEEDRVEAYAQELDYYRHRGSSKLIKEGFALSEMLSRDDVPEDAIDAIEGFKTDVEEMLTEWARRILRNNYVWFGPFEHSGDVGFQYAVESALDDCDLRLDAGDTVPTGFSGMVAFVTDHGNVSVHTYSRGRRTRTLFDVV